MPNDIILSTKADFSKAIESFAKFKDQLDTAAESFRKAGDGAQESIAGNTRATETMLSKMGNVAKSVLRRMGEDFKALASMESLAAGLKLSDQFKGSIRETVSLSDTIRKLGESFGISKDKFIDFQTKLTKGMGDIGLSSEEAANVIKGLAGTGVQGEAAVGRYAQTAGQLASLGNEKGRGGEVAGGLAAVTRARGLDVNDTKNVNQLAQEVTKAMAVTGKGASELLGEMKNLFTNMDPDRAKRFGAKGAAQLGVVSSVAGPESTAFLKRMLSMNKEERAGLEAQGLGKLFDKSGTLNLKALRDIQKEMKSRGVSTGLAARTLGLSEEEGKGLARLISSADRAGEALEAMDRASGDFAAKQRTNMTMQEAFQASVNRVKSLFAGPLSQATQGVSNMLSKASGSTGGAGAVVAGGGLLAAMLAGGGLRGIGKGLGGMAKREGYESVTGRKVQDVYVVNAGEISGGLTGGVSGATGFLGKAGMYGGAAAVGVGAGLGLNKLHEAAQGKDVSPALKVLDQVANPAAVVDRITDLFKPLIEKMAGGGTITPRQQKVTVELNKRELREAKQPTRGASAGSH